jgi:hemerythrin-like domain-containing protein
VFFGITNYVAAIARLELTTSCAIATGSSAAERDIVDMLVDEHKNALDMLQQVQVETDATKRRTLGNTVITDLVRHSIAEESLVYPLIAKELPNGPALKAKNDDEHEELEKLMSHLEKCNAALPEFTAAAKTLEEALARHRLDQCELSYHIDLSICDA